MDTLIPHRTVSPPVSRYRALALFVGLAAAWGGSFPAIEVGLEELPPVLFAAVRYDVAAVLLLSYAVATAQWRPRTLTDGWAVLAAGAFLVAGNSLLFVGQQHVPSGVAAVLYSLVPILTTAFAWPLLPDERRSAAGLVGVALGLVGVTVVVQPDPANLLAADVVGAALIVLAAASVSLGSVLVRRSSPTLSTAGLTAWAMAVGALLLHAASLAVGEPLPASPSPAVVGALVYLAVVATAGAFVVYFHLLDRFGPLEINLVSYVVPVVAVVVGWALIDETVTGATLGGFLVVFAGFALLKRHAIADELPRIRAALGA